ncbi:MAG: AAA family ATPase, partial [Acidimicrobiia bacterium]
AQQRGRVTAVIGCRGAPGTTEVAVAYALSQSRHEDVLLIDLDLSAPSVAIRLGLPARPDLTDVAGAVRGGDGVSGENVQRFAGMAVVTGSHRTDEASLKQSHIDAVVHSASAEWSEIVLDLGADPVSFDRVADADASILVVEASAIGIVRAAQLVSDWVGPAPALVLNKVEPRAAAEMEDAVRKWTGLDPELSIPDRRKVRTASQAALRPDRRFSKSVARLGHR